ncbi:glycosyltransferase [Marinobacter pelagius]|uniref:Glycosyl transferase family 2 n=1 Tax=Marinobacter pelagius TaxID=379482 RepID=A0A1I4U135_9GAMM|nr:glycosyltransferase [Marinobacter pelagius]SFM82758.1 Glycosyl transferase family 2 [Marinobacter pelagius]
MPTTKPKISVLVLTFNQAQFIQRALQSVVEQQSNNYDLEIIVTDDGSSDGTVDVIERFAENSPVSIKVLAKKHEGITAIAKNFLSMINLADGDFIGFLAGDDSFSQNRFSLQLEKFAANPNLRISYSDGVNCAAGELGQRCHSVETVDLMRSGDTARVFRHLTSQAPVLFIQGVLAKADFLKRIQPFDVDLIADDWVFNIKVFYALMTHGGDFDFEPSVCFIRNIHGENTSRNLIVHYERVRQVADRYCNNARLIKSRFVGNSLFSAVKKKRNDELIFFIGKMFKLPEALYWFFRALILSVHRKFGLFLNF